MLLKVWHQQQEEHTIDDWSMPEAAQNLVLKNFISKDFILKSSFPKTVFFSEKKKLYLKKMK